MEITCKGSCQSKHHLHHHTARCRISSLHEASLHTMEVVVRNPPVIVIIISLFHLLSLKAIILFLIHKKLKRCQFYFLI